MESTLTYLWHDCFVYRGRSCMIIFDYWHDCVDRLCGNTLSLSDMLQTAGDLPVYVLVSHHHKDHYNRRIFSLASALPDVRFIISKDTARAANYLLKEGSTYAGPLKVDRDRVAVLREGDVYEDSNIKVSAFGSTDIGNSYVVQADGLTLFHAGDLNAWIWKEESTEAEVATAISEFEEKVRAIQASFPRIDYAMFPVDARIGRDWWEGAWRFVRMIDVGNFIPMHFCLYEDEEERVRYIRCATAFALYANPERGKYVSMTIPGETLGL